MKLRPIYISLVIILLLMLPYAVALGGEEDGNYAKVTLYLDKPDISLLKDGITQNKQLDVSPCNPDGTTLIPIRGVMDSFGANIEWIGDKRQVEISDTSNKILLTLDSDLATVNGVSVKMDRPAQIINSRTMIPIRFVSENLGYVVKWYGNENKIEIINQLVASVNGQSINLGDYNRMKAIYEYIFENNYGKDVWEQKDSKGIKLAENFNNILINDLLTEETLYQTANTDKIVPNTDEVTAEVKKYLDSSQKDPVLAEVLKNNSINEVYLQRKISREMVVNTFKQNYIKTIKISDSDIEKYYKANLSTFKDEKVKAAHILIKTLDSSKTENKAANEAALKKAQDILKRARSGEDFAQLAKQYSEDTGSAAQGGELGYFGRGQMVKPFEEAAFALKIGQISDLVQSNYGYHIIMAEDHTYGTLSLEQVSDYIKSKLIDDKLKDHINELKKAASIKTFNIK